MRIASAVFVASVLVGLAASPVIALDAVDGSATATLKAVRLNNATQVDTPPAPEAARYEITVEVAWNASTHPSTLPPNAHFSPFVVAAHDSSAGIFATGTVASPGVESMAETGQTSTLQTEFRNEPSIFNFEVGEGARGSASLPFVLQFFQNGSYLSAVSMLAPSPDWFVGVEDIELFRNGAWVERLEIPLGNFDAGTDSGAGFTSSNADTDPAQAISGPRDGAFSGAVAEAGFGRIVVQLIS